MMRPQPSGNDSIGGHLAALEGHCWEKGGNALAELTSPNHKKVEKTALSYSSWWDFCHFSTRVGELFIDFIATRTETLWIPVAE